jgi:hypothetical protein
MQDTTRFELRLSAVQRQALASLADEAGLTSAGVARLAVLRLLNHPNVLLGRQPDGEHPA